MDVSWFIIIHQKTWKSSGLRNGGPHIIMDSQRPTLCGRHICTGDIFLCLGDELELWKSCRNLAVILHNHIPEGTNDSPYPIKGYCSQPPWEGAIFCEPHVFPRTFRWAKCQAPLPGIQSLMMSCKGSDSGIRLQYVYLDSKEFELLLGGSCTIFSHIVFVDPILWDDKKFENSWIVCIYIILWS